MLAHASNATRDRDRLWPAEPKDKSRDNLSWWPAVSCTAPRGAEAQTVRAAVNLGACPPTALWLQSAAGTPCGWLCHRSGMELGVQRKRGLSEQGAQMPEQTPRENVSNLSLRSQSPSSRTLPILAWLPPDSTKSCFFSRTILLKKHLGKKKSVGELEWPMGAVIISGP